MYFLSPGHFNSKEYFHCCSQNNLLTETSQHLVNNTKASFLPFQHFSTVAPNSKSPCSVAFSIACLKSQLLLLQIPQVSEFTLRDFRDKKHQFGSVSLVMWRSNKRKLFPKERRNAEKIFAKNCSLRFRCF